MYSRSAHKWRRRRRRCPHSRRSSPRRDIGSRCCPGERRIRPTFRSSGSRTSRCRRSFRSACRRNSCASDPTCRPRRRSLHQASAQAGVATANLYPQLNLTGSIGSETLRASDLFKPGTAAWSIGGSLTQPLFHGGELIEKRAAAFADLDRAAAQYRGGGAGCAAGRGRYAARAGERCAQPARAGRCARRPPRETLEIAAQAVRGRRRSATSRC